MTIHTGSPEITRLLILTTSIPCLLGRKHGYTSSSPFKETVFNFTGFLPAQEPVCLVQVEAKRGHLNPLYLG